MNGYEMTANTYRRLLEKETDHAAITDMQSKLKVYSFLAELTEKEILEIFNSGAFNDVCKGYMLAALDHIGIDHDTQKKAVYAIGAEFDSMNAKQAEAYYMAR